MSLLIFAISLFLYYTLHSVLASEKTKAILSGIISQKYYRIIYNLLAIVLFTAIFIYYFFIEKTALWSPNSLLPYPGGLLVLTGLIWVIKALKGYNMGEFLGLEQLKTGAAPQHETLIISGLNAQVRHPLYFGTLLIAWGVFFIFPTDAMLVFGVLTTLYLIIGARLEERKLERQFGEAYRKYKAVVPGIVPFKWGKNK